MRRTLRLIVMELLRWNWRGWLAAGVVQLVLSVVLASEDDIVGALLGNLGLLCLAISIVAGRRQRRLRTPDHELSPAERSARLRSKRRSAWLIAAVGLVYSAISVWDVFWYVPHFCAENNTCIPIELLATYPGLVIGPVLVVWAIVRWRAARSGPTESQPVD